MKFSIQHIIFLSLLLQLGCDGEAGDSIPDVVASGVTSDGDESKFADGPLAIDVVKTRKALFGDLHVHTAVSFDSYIFGVRGMPDDAYRFAQGQPVTHEGGVEIQLEGQPLDFYAVTDHGEYLGIMPAMDNPEHPLSRTDTAKAIFGGDPGTAQATFQKLVSTLVTQEPLTEIDDRQTLAESWNEAVATANRHYRPGLFTTFAAYEFTAMKKVALEGVAAVNLHRNVIFENSAPTEIFTSLTSSEPSHLWGWMESKRAEGFDSLAIPHNSNVSNGLMFSATDDEGKLLSLDIIQKRRRNEPLIEIAQIKGTSDTRPLFSEQDEWAEFEHYPYLVASDKLNTDAEGSYARPSLSKGLGLRLSAGTNPFEFGFVGSSDTHLAAWAYTEKEYWSTKAGERRVSSSSAKKVQGLEQSEDKGAAHQNTKGILLGDSAIRRTSGGLAGVWAESNTRESIFAAMKRRETFGTSGPRIQVRFFAGDYPGDLLASAKALEFAYEQGVPMGGRLDEQVQAPTMVIWALQDPLSAPLQRAQVIKVWRNERGEHDERVFDVACSSGVPDSIYRCPDNGADVNVNSCELSPGSGQAELKALWHDPEFDAGQSAAYFVRVLENPSCRWTTWDTARAGADPDPRLPATIQERAWSSPIWVN